MPELAHGEYTIKSFDQTNALFEEIVIGDETLIIGDKPISQEIQKWHVQKNADGSYYLQSRFTAKYLAVDGAPKNGATLIGSESPQKWNIKQSSGTDSWLIRVPETKLSVHLPDNKQGTKCRLEDGGEQSWFFSGQDMGGLIQAMSMLAERYSIEALELSETLR